MNQADADGKDSTEGLTSGEKKELAELRRRNKQLRWRTTFSSGRRRTSRGRTYSQSNLLAGP
jgi:hypothetical protein